jgi:hypothetical protein
MFSDQTFVGIFFFIPDVVKTIYPPVVPLKCGQLIEKFPFLFFCL